MRYSPIFFVFIMLLSTGCATLPNGPSVMVLPGSGQSFDQFRTDDTSCREYAYYQIGGTTANNAGIQSGVATAAIGTAIGAAAGAALTGNAAGAAIGAGTGLVGGSLVGASTASSSQYSTQHHYDVAYIQCMYSKGHQVPVSGQFSNPAPQQAVSQSIPPPPPSVSTSSETIPPPPPGSPPPPPPK